MRPIRCILGIHDWEPCEPTLEQKGAAKRLTQWIGVLSRDRVCLACRAVQRRYDAVLAGAERRLARERKALAIRAGEDPDAEDGALSVTGTAGGNLSLLDGDVNGE